MGFDRNAPKRAVSFTLNEDLVRQAAALTDDLTGTLEGLLGEFVARQRSQHPPEDAALSRYVDAWGAYHSRYGLLSDDVADL